MYLLYTYTNHIPIGLHEHIPIPFLHTRAAFGEEAQSRRRRRSDRGRICPLSENKMADRPT